MISIAQFRIFDTFRQIADDFEVGHMVEITHFSTQNL